MFLPGRAMHGAPTSLLMRLFYNSVEADVIIESL